MNILNHAIEQCTGNGLSLYFSLLLRDTITCVYVSTDTEGNDDLISVYGLKRCVCVCVYEWYSVVGFTDKLLQMPSDYNGIFVIYTDREGYISSFNRPQPHFTVWRGMLRLVDDLHHKLWRGVVALVIDVELYAEGRRPNLRYGPIWLGLIMMEIRMKLNFILNINSISILIWKFSIQKSKFWFQIFFFF